MSEPFLGEIRMVGFNFAPYGWALCQGQAMPISQNAPLFSLLGVTFGGNGQTNFNLPDFQGRSPVGMGNGTGLAPIAQGQVAGTENVTLTSMQMPMHTHPVTVAGTATTPVPAPTTTNNVLGASGPGPGSATIWSTTMTNPIPLSPAQVGMAGGSQPVPIRNPYLGTNFIIALQGVFPSRG